MGWMRREFECMLIVKSERFGFLIQGREGESSFQGLCAIIHANSNITISAIGSIEVRYRYWDRRYLQIESSESVNKYAP